MCEIYGQREREREREALILIESFPKSVLKTEITVGYAQWEDTEEHAYTILSFTLVIDTSQCVLTVCTDRHICLSRHPLVRPDTC